MDIQSFCLEQCARYPALGIQDLVKALYQSEFGCGHLISDPQKGLAFLTAELHTCRQPETTPPLVESLGESFCRVHLQAAAAFGLSAQTLFRLFELSAAEPAGSMESFRSQLDTLEALVKAGTLPLSASDVHDFLADYRLAGCPGKTSTSMFPSSPPCCWGALPGALSACCFPA